MHSEELGIDNSMCVVLDATQTGRFREFLILTIDIKLPQKMCRRHRQVLCMIAHLRAVPIDITYLV